MRSLAHGNRVLRFGTYQIDTGSGQLRRHGTEIKLQEQPFQILSILLEHPGELVTRDRLRHELWADDMFVDFDRSLNTAVTKLRRALCDSAENPRFIETVPRHGYRFIAPVSQDSHVESPLQLVAVNGVDLHACASGTLQSSSSPVAPDGWRYKKWLLYLYGLAAGVVVASCLGLGYARLFRPSQIRNLPLSTGRHSVVVLGFKNLTGDRDHAWLSTALSDWLGAELAAGDQLRMIPAEDVARMNVELALPEVNSLGQDTLQRIKQNLGSDWIVSGSYASLRSASGADVRVDIRLQDAATGETIGTVSETGSESHLFEVISRAGEHLRAKLDVDSVTPRQQAEVAMTLPSNQGAARFYAEGLNKLRNYDAMDARDLFLKAIAIEPNDALLHSALASAWSKLGHDPNAIAEAKKTSELSFSLPRAERSLILARQFEISNNWEKAIETYRLLFEFYPDRIDYGLSLVYAQVKGGKGKGAENTILALRRLRTSLADESSIDLAEAYAADSQGNLKTALDSADKGAEKARSIGASVLLAHALTLRANELRGLGRLDEAAKAVSEASRLFDAVGDKDGLARSQAMGAHLLNLQGDFVEASRTFEASLSTFRAIGDREGVARALNSIAVARKQLGDLKGAYKYLQEALIAWSELLNQKSVALTQSNIGEVLLDAGDLRGAEQRYRQSLIICQTTDNSDLAAHDLEGLGRVLQAQGRLKEAQQDEIEAIAIFNRGGQTQIIDAYVSLAGILLDLGLREDAAVAAGKALEQIDRFGFPAHYRSDAEAALARVFVAQGKASESREIMGTATAMPGRKPSKESEFVLSIVAARVRSASVDRLEKAEAAKSLRLIVAETQRTGFVLEEFEARLALGETELDSGDSLTGRAQLMALKEAASGKGFGLIARKIHAILYAQPDIVSKVLRLPPKRI